MSRQLTDGTFSFVRIHAESTEMASKHLKKYWSRFCSSVISGIAVDSLGQQPALGPSLS